MLTIFTSCKPFLGLDEVMQRNAIESWTLLSPRPEIILMGDEVGAEEAAKESGLKYIPEIKRSKFGNPFVDDIFYRAQADASNNVLCYVNADIILMSDFMKAVEKSVRYRQRFLMIGKRYDLDVNGRLEHGPGWEGSLKKRVETEGNLYRLPGIDYFVFNRGLLSGIPPFVLGSIRWDNWMVYNALRKRITVIDATGAVKAVHQNHEITGTEAIVAGNLSLDEKAAYNCGLYGKYLPCFFNLDATHVVTVKGVEPAASLEYRVRRLRMLPVLMFPALCSVTGPVCRLGRYLLAQSKWVPVRAKNLAKKRDRYMKERMTGTI